MLLLLFSGLNAYRHCSGTLPVQNREGRRGRGNLGRGKREGGRVKPLARRYPSPFTLHPSRLPPSPFPLPLFQAFSTWPKSSSTGVERPKMVTATRILFLS